jgi:Collagen triple helix repeat (20 copies)
MKTAGWFTRIALAAALLGSLSAFSQPTDATQNWAAPPYWTPPAVSLGDADQGGRAPAAGRQALVTSPVPLPFVAITPCRQYDSRSGSVLSDNTPRTVTLIGAPCAIPSDAQAVAANITVFNISGAGSNGVFRAGTVAPPTTAWINYPPTETQRANAGVLPLGAGGTIVVQVNQGAGSVDFVVDVFGYYSPLGIVNHVNGLTGDVTLVAGANVSITPSANTLTIAAAGATGPAGPQGPAGAAGATGPLGPIGLTAATGPLGPMGPAGLTGPQGPAGATGAKGATGSLGPIGLTGATGATGPIGPAGPIGPIGPTGASGGGAPSGSMVLGAPGDTTLIGAGYTEIAPSRFDYWTATTTTGAPSGRQLHTAVWTGSRMIVWGGFDNGVYVNDGGQYDPVANAWTATTTTGAPAIREAHTAVWTGSRMIVWGGFDGGAYLNTGGQYDPSGNAWTATTTTGAPSARAYDTAVWTGSKMIVWGGTPDGLAHLNDGGLYDPVANAWTATTTTGAPSVRYYHTTVWTGSKMIVWGGFGISGELNTGGQYDPSGNAWTATNTSGAPAGRALDTAVWTGSRMIVWGGFDGGASLNTGGQYDPSGNAWTATTTANAPPGSYYHTAVWTGSRMIVWGGSPSPGTYLNDGGQWRPVSLYVKN